MQLLGLFNLSNRFLLILLFSKQLIHPGNNIGVMKKIFTSLSRFGFILGPSAPLEDDSMNGIEYLECAERLVGGRRVSRADTSEG